MPTVGPNDAKSTENSRIELQSGANAFWLGGLDACFRTSRQQIKLMMTLGWRPWWWLSQSCKLSADSLPLSLSTCCAILPEGLLPVEMFLLEVLLQLARHHGHELGEV